MYIAISNSITSSSQMNGAAASGGGGGGFTNTYSLAFDAVDDLITVPDDASLRVASGNHSLTFWMKNSLGNVRVVMEKGRNDELVALIINNKIYWGGQNGYYGGSVSVVDGNWLHIAFVANGSTSEIFINGSSVATGGNKIVASANTDDFIMGSSGTIGFYGGLLDEVAIFDYALSGSDVAAIYNSGVPNNLDDLTTPPTAWYRNGDNGSYKSPQWLIPENSNVANSRISNYSLQLDGVDDYIDVGNPTSLQITGNMTLSAWIKTSDTSAYEFIIGKDDVGSNRSYGLLRVGNNLRFFIAKSGVISNVTGTSTINDGAWYHVLGVNDGTDLKLYVNGSLENTNSGGGGAIDNDSSNFNIGARASIAGLAGYWTGSIDEVAVWNSDQSANVASIYGGGTPSAITGAVAHWRMGEEANFTSNWLVNNSALSNYSTRSFNFDGVDDRIDVGAVSFLPSATNLTVSTWLKTSDVTDNQVVFGDNSATPIFSFEYWGSANRMYFEYGSGLYCYLTLNLVVSNDVWHNLALVYDGSGATNTDKIKIYINGVDKSSSLTFVGTVPTALNASIGNLWLGNGQNYNSPFLGNIDEFAIWNSSLTQENITSIYGGGTPSSISSLSPISHWRMGEDATFSTNWSLPDNGSASNTGTSANMTIADLEGDAPNYTGGGLSNNMTIEDRTGDAPNSTSNAVSFNMTESDRETDVPS